MATTRQQLEAKRNRQTEIYEELTTIHKTAEDKITNDAGCDLLEEHTHFLTLYDQFLELHVQINKDITEDLAESYTAENNKRTTVLAAAKKYFEDTAQAQAAKDGALLDLQTQRKKLQEEIEELKRQKSELGNVTKNDPKKVPHKPKVSVVSSDSLDSANSMVLTSIVKQLKRPTFEMTKFSGNPLKFIRFERQFNLNVLQVIDSASERFAMLDQYTTGEANQIVQGYMHLKDEVAFDKAYEKLKSRYGAKDVVAQSYIRRALEWPVVSPHDSKALDSYSLFLNEVNSAILDVDQMNVLNYPSNLTRLVSKLPTYMHDKFRGVAESIRDDRAVHFSDLATFVEKESRKACDPLFGQTAFENIGVYKQRRKTGSYATNAASHGGEHKSNKGDRPSDQWKNRDVEQTKRGCIYCLRDNHPLAGCFNFAKLDFDVRKQLIRDYKCCFKCLKKGHQSRECRSEVRW